MPWSDAPSSPASSDLLANRARAGQPALVQLVQLVQLMQLMQLVQLVQLTAPRGRSGRAGLAGHHGAAPVVGPIDHNHCIIIIRILLFLLSYDCALEVLMSSTAGVPDNIRQRIITAAEQLWDESGRGDKLPTVNEVRIRANCDMNAATLVVREWKRLQGAKPEPVVAPVPEPVMAIFVPVVGAAWDAAQDLANASLRAAQADWELERSQAETMRAELSRLWQEQDEALEQARIDVAQCVREKEAAEQANLVLQGQIRELEVQLADQKHETAQANARTEEIERKASDLKEQLGIAHADLKEVREELRDARVKHTDALKELETASASELDKAHSAHATTQGRLDQVSDDLAKLQNTYNAETLSLRTELATAKATLDANQRLHLEQRQNAAEAANQMAQRFTKLQDERDAAVTEAASLGGQVAALEKLLPRK